MTIKTVLSQSSFFFSPVIFSNFSSFLEPEDLARCETVSRIWNMTIRSPGHAVWKQQCVIQKMVPTSSAPTTVLALNTLRACIYRTQFNAFEQFDDSTTTLIAEYAFEKTFEPNNFTPKILDIISQYSELLVTDYKAAMSRVIKGEIFMKDGHCSVFNRNRIEETDLGSETNDSALFFFTDTYSNESRAFCQTLHSPNCTNPFKETWFHTHPRVPKFPKHLSISLFINADGSYKNNGQTIRIKYRLKYIILTCRNNALDTSVVNDLPFATLQDAITERVRHSLGTSHTTKQAITRAKATAATRIQGEWIDID
jgi:hypothetical protein